MKKSRFTEEPMIAILRQADRTSVPEISKKYKVGEQTVYVWRRKFGAMEPADVKRLRSLELENANLKKLVAERDLSKRRAPEHHCRRGPRAQRVEGGNDSIRVLPRK